MGKTVAELAAALSNEELIEWMAYYSFDPWGGYRSDLQAAHQVAATIDYKGEIADLMLFDPDPLPPDEIKRNEDAALVAKLERETQQMAALFDIAE